MLHNDRKVQVSDTTDDATHTSARIKKIKKLKCFNNIQTLKPSNTQTLKLY